MNVKDLTDFYKCDYCGKSFQGKEVGLAKPADNIDILYPPVSILAIDKKGIIIRLDSTTTLRDSDRLLACPHCNKVHLFGFSRVSEVKND